MRGNNLRGINLALKKEQRILSYESTGHSLAVTVLYVPTSPGSAVAKLLPAPLDVPALPRNSKIKLTGLWVNWLWRDH